MDIFRKLADAHLAIFILGGALDDGIKELKIYSETNCDGLMALGGR